MLLHMNTAGILEALIPLCAGIYATLLGFGQIAVAVER